MPRIKPAEVAEALRPPRTAAQLANDARMSAKKGTKKVIAAPSVFIRKNMLGPDDVDPANNQISISTSGLAEITRMPIEPVDPANMLDMAENEMYMNEIVEIMIEASEDPNAPLFVHSGHNGSTQFIERGKPQKIKRKYLYSMVVSKVARLVCAFGKDANTGQEYNRLTGPSLNTHRVVILNDSARGRADYKIWMAQE